MSSIKDGTNLVSVISGVSDSLNGTVGFLFEGNLVIREHFELDSLNPDTKEIVIAKLRNLANKIEGE